MSTSIYSTGHFNMSGLQIDEKHQVIENGRVFFGSNFILDKGGSYEFIIQSLPEDQPTKKIELSAKSQRGARMELNKMFPQLRNAYSKPRFITIEKLEAEIIKRDQLVGKGGY